jgi:hypothetical protein
MAREVLLHPRSRITDPIGGDGISPPGDQPRLPVHATAR